LLKLKHSCYLVLLSHGNFIAFSKTQNAMVTDPKENYPLP